MRSSCSLWGVPSEWLGSGSRRWIISPKRGQRNKLFPCHDRSGGSFWSKILQQAVDVPPVRPVPEELAAFCAFHIDVAARVRFGRDPITNCFLLNRTQCAAARHTPWRTTRQAERPHDVAELSPLAAGVERNQQGRRDAPADCRPLHHPPVSGQHDRAALARLLQKFVVVNARPEARVVSGGAQPAGRSAQTRVAVEVGAECAAGKLRWNGSFEQIPDGGAVPMTFYLTRSAREPTRFHPPMDELLNYLRPDAPVHMLAAVRVLGERLVDALLQAVWLDTPEQAPEGLFALCESSESQVLLFRACERVAIVPMAGRCAPFAPSWLVWPLLTAKGEGGSQVKRAPTSLEP